MPDRLGAQNVELHTADAPPQPESENTNRYDDGALRFEGLANTFQERGRLGVCDAT